MALYDPKALAEYIRGQRMVGSVPSFTDDPNAPYDEFYIDHSGRPIQQTVETTAEQPEVTPIVPVDEIATSYEARQEQLIMKQQLEQDVLAHRKRLEQESGIEALEVKNQVASNYMGVGGQLGASMTEQYNINNALIANKRRDIEQKLGLKDGIVTGSMAVDYIDRLQRMEQLDFRAKTLEALEKGQEDLDQRASIIKQQQRLSTAVDPATEAEFRKMFPTYDDEGWIALLGTASSPLTDPKLVELATGISRGRRPDIGQYMVTGEPYLVEALLNNYGSQEEQSATDGKAAILQSEFAPAMDAAGKAAQLALQTGKTGDNQYKLASPKEKAIMEQQAVTQARMSEYQRQQDVYSEKYITNNFTELALEGISFTKEESLLIQPFVSTMDTLLKSGTPFEEAVKKANKAMTFAGQRNPMGGMSALSPKQAIVQANAIETMAGNIRKNFNEKNANFMALLPTNKQLQALEAPAIISLFTAGIQ